jgi:hypothetical protein
MVEEHPRIQRSSTYIVSIYAESQSTVIPITLRNTEDGGDMFSETSILTTVIRYKVPEDIYQSSSEVSTFLLWYVNIPV